MLSELVLIAMLLALPAETQPARDLPFRVIVPRGSSQSAISRAELSAIFMMRTRRWPDGSAILPVDQGPRSPIREHFSRSIHGKSVSYVIRYWQRVIFAGRGLPPRELPSDAAVIDFVTTNRGAIGYISREATVSEGVRVIVIKP